MEALSSGMSMLSHAPYLLVIPIYIVLSPLCIISSSLFDAVLCVTFDLDQQTSMLILVLLTIWALSAVYIFQLIRNRACKSIFFYSFVFYLSCFNFILIGITYSYLRRNNIVEEMLAKIFSTMLLVYFAEIVKIKTEASSCQICFEGTYHHDCMILRCNHLFHEKCLWDWLYVKNQCPKCWKTVY